MNRSWLLLFAVIHWVDGQKVAIDPLGVFRAKQGGEVILRCGYPFTTTRDPRVVYNGQQSQVVQTTSGTQSHISIGLFSAFATALGANNTHIFFNLNFTLLSQYNDASIRIVVTTGASTLVYSSFLNLTVLSSPCCNVSGSSVRRNATDSPALLRLNCSDIIRERGNPPAIISWAETSGCNGMQSGEANQFYDIDPISRQCNGADITCTADTKDASLEITTKTFHLIIRSSPGSLTCSFELIRPIATFSWNEPQDNGGFPVIDYEFSVNGSSINWVQGHPMESSTMVKDGDQLKFSVSAVNSLGSGPSCKINKTIPTRKCVTPNQGKATTRTSIQVNCSTDTTFDSGVYIVYYSGNGTSKSQMSEGLPTIIRGLMPNTSYMIRVEASNSEGLRENSSSVMLSTNAPGQPSSVTLTNDNVKDITATSFTLMFNSVQDAGRDNVSVAQYRVYINDRGEDHASQNGPMQTIKIENLTPGREYKVKVAAINGLDEIGDNSSTISVATLEKEKSGGLSGGAIGGICVGCVALIAVIIIVIWYVKFRSSSKNGEPTVQERKTDEKNTVKKKRGGGDGVEYAELELAQAGPAPVKENRAKDGVTYSDVKPPESTQYAELDLAKQTPEKEEKNLKKVKKAKEGESVSYTGVTKLADH